MIFVNEFGSAARIPREAAEALIKLLAPFAPHVCEEMWQVTGHNNTIAYEAWPKYNQELIKTDEIEIAVQWMGRPRVKLMVPAEAAPEMIEKIALNDERVKALLVDKIIKKVVVVPGRLVNIVT
jgi:leucyl-tRNA synthetase